MSHEISWLTEIDLRHSLKRGDSRLVSREEFQRMCVNIDDIIDRNSWDEVRSLSDVEVYPGGSTLNVMRTAQVISTDH